MGRRPVHIREMKRQPKRVQVAKSSHEAAELEKRLKDECDKANSQEAQQLTSAEHIKSS